MFNSVFLNEQPRVVDLLTVCAWCNRVKVRVQGIQVYWIEMDASHHQMNGRTVTHTICPTCKARMEHQMKEAM